ncbi:Carboxylic ester hydrolase [Pleurostoma richardsiae]|uniref:Carboxylic ester hydrolase n=1 Tax=Pleurostoma richardsiae TaxID=41990 RepID=A0AA38SAZ7_9PEZI|nr:Carboxylic ester hydrolase [Pleurostoma richardsiae]
MRVSSLITMAGMSSAVTLPTINTTLGYVTGMISPFRSGAATVYKGIPYAAPPTGNLRWAEPQPATPWNGTLNATTFGPQCAQQVSSAGIFSSGKTTYSEDCLTLNIWTPTYNDTSDLASSNLPVYVWIFGGRFEGGSGDVPTYDGTGLATKGIIVVTLNYRLGAFGYLAHPELLAESVHNTTGNYGLMDQHFALRWVKDNIANFGGNPDHVVVGGQSAGSASALDVMYTNLTDGLVVGVIAESGARAPKDPMTGGLATSHRYMDDALEQGEAYIASLNVSTIAEARNISVSVLIEGDSDMDTTFDDTVFVALPDAFSDPPLWRPVVDGYVLPYAYGEALRSGNHLDVPILTGNNHDESGASPDTSISVTDYVANFTTVLRNYSTEFLELYPSGDNDSTAGDSFNTFFRDLSRVSTWTWANQWAAGGAKSNVYHYFFEHSPAENSAAGSYHGAELWYVFNNIPYTDYSNVTWTSYDILVESIMSQYWANFITYLDPNGDGTSNMTYWPASSSSNATTMWLGNTWGASYLANTTAKIDFIGDWMSVLHEW